MKAFYASLIVFGLLLTLIIGNGFFVRSATAELEEALSALRELPASEEKLVRVEMLWEKHRAWLSLSVSYEELKELEGHLLALRAAQETKAACVFENARLAALETLGRIRSLETFSLRNLI